MARRRDDGPRLDRPGQPPLLQGHLKPGGVRPDDDSRPAAQPAETMANDGTAQPAEDVSAADNTQDAARGRATKSPADVATRPHLEGSEQSPA